MNNKELEEAAEQFEYTDGIYGFKQGAKFQAERMYSEEDMVEFSKWRVIYEENNPNNVKHSKTLLQMWFEQFKKK